MTLTIVPSWCCGSQWASDPDISKKVLVASCPARGGCGLTLEAFEVNKPRVKGKHDELTKEGTQGPAPSFQAEVPHQDEDSSQCKGVKINGSQCPRSSNEAGGNMVRGLCRRCLEKFEATAALAAAAAAAATAATASTGPAYGKQHADPPKAKVSKKKKCWKDNGPWAASPKCCKTNQGLSIV